jgi:hypothetical protein
MTREQQIKAAIKVLEPMLITEADYATARERIADTLNDIDDECGYEGPQETKRPQEVESKKGQDAIAAYVVALRKLKTAEEHLPGLVVRNLPELEDLNPRITAVEAWLLDKPVRRQVHSATRKVLAVVAAESLLYGYELPVTCRRGSRWHLLSAILFGDQKRDLYAHMRQTFTGKK